MLARTKLLKLIEYGIQSGLEGNIPVKAKINECDLQLGLNTPIYTEIYIFTHSL